MSRKSAPSPIQVGGSDSADDFHFGLKVVLIGESGVGKSSIANALLETEGLVSDYSRLQSVGIRFRVSSTTVHSFEKEGCLYRVQIWDAPGAQRFQKLSGRLCAGCSGAIFVFDVTNLSSFERVEGWVRDVERSGAPVVKVLVGNKADDASQRQVSPEQIDELVQRLGCPYIETVATRGQGVREVFETLYSQIIHSIPNPPEPTLLLRKSIRIGHRLADNVKYRQALYSQHMEGTTETADWL